MAYSMKDVVTAADRLRRERPDLRLATTDYDFGLRAYNPATAKAVILFQPARPENGQEEIVAPMDEALRFLDVA